MLEDYKREEALQNNALLEEGHVQRKRLVLSAFATHVDEILGGAVVQMRAHLL